MTAWKAKTGRTRTIINACVPHKVSCNLQASAHVAMWHRRAQNVVKQWQPAFRRAADQRFRRCGFSLPHRTADADTMVMTPEYPAHTAPMMTAPMTPVMPTAVPAHIHQRNAGLARRAALRCSHRLCGGRRGCRCGHGEGSGREGECRGRDVDYTTHVASWFLQCVDPDPIGVRAKTCSAERKPTAAAMVSAAEYHTGIFEIDGTKSRNAIDVPFAEGIAIALISKRAHQIRRVFAMERDRSEEF